jgi:hypothetical protein
LALVATVTPANLSGKFGIPEKWRGVSPVGKSDFWCHFPRMARMSADKFRQMILRFDRGEESRL